METKKKSKKRKPLMRIYKEGNFVYAEYDLKITPKEHLAVLGLLQTVIETTKQGTGKWLH